MKYKSIDGGSYKLHLLKTDKFKTITVRINFRREIKKDEITVRNFLSDLLTHSANKYKTKKELVIKTQDLYAINWTAVTSRLGDHINTAFTLECLNDRYTEEGNFKASLEFVKDVLLDPNVEDEKFNSEAFDMIYESAKNSLVGMKENSTYYSLVRCLENMAPDTPISYRMAGYLEDLEKITPKSAYEYYKDMIKKDKIDIFVVGNFDFKEMEQNIKEYFTFNTFKRPSKVNLLEVPKKQIRKKIVKEQENNKQSKLVIGCRLVGLTREERNYALTLYSLILGGSSGDSKLFNEVREKKSLVYYINSVPNKLDNILLIRAGISKENFDKTIKLIDKQLQAMKKGDFSESDIKKAVEIYNTSLQEVEENPSYLIETHYLMELVGIDEIKERYKKIKQVTKEDIIKVAKKVKMDTIYLLEGTEE